MAYYSHSEEVPPAPLEMIGDLIYAPGADLPFGKNIHIGPKEEVIYESVIERGYQAGIDAHHAFLKDHNSSTPIVLDDKQFTMILKHLVPKEMTAFEKGLWRSFFIVGWTCVYLGVETQMNE